MRLVRKGRRTKALSHFFCLFRVLPLRSHLLQLCSAVFKETLRQHLEKNVSSQELSRWFDPLRVVVDEQGKTVRVFFPHTFFGHWFMRTIKQDFESAAGSLAGEMRIIYEDGPDFSKTLPHVSFAKKLGLPDLRPPEHSSVGMRPSPPIEYGAASLAVQAEGDAAKQTGQQLRQCSLHNFLANRKNNFPLAAARKVISNALNSGTWTTEYTPFVLYGQSGSGKTHLLASMANALEDNGLDFFYGDISYLERMRVSPGRYARMQEELVFLDDVQRVSACGDMQEALSALIDMFQEKNRLLCLTFDAHPADCPGLGQKLRSRLTSGLVVELKRPDLDIRRQYVQRKNDEHHLDLSRDQVLALAQRHYDIRSIDGALTRLLAYRSLIGAQEASPSDPSSILDQGAEHSFLTPAGIIAVVAGYFSVKADELIGKRREKKLSLARHLAIFLCRDMLGLSLVQTGRIFDGRDHSSVLYSLRKVKKLQASNKDVHKHVDELRKLCLNKR